MFDTLRATGLGRLISRAVNPAASRYPAPGLTADQRQFFDRNGFLVLPGFFAPDRVAALRAHLDRLWEHRNDQGDVAIDVHFGLPDAARIFFRKAPPETRSLPYKILDLHLTDETIRDACSDGGLMRAVGALLGANPIVCNSLLFEWGSQQDAHFDTFFMPSKTRNMMAASWIALDRVTPDNGPLFYYPGSHLIEPYRFSHGKLNAIFAELKTGAAAHIDRIVEQYGLQKQIFLPEPGDVLIWHAQLLHGGSPIANPAETRRSIVTHYWTDLDYPDPAQRIDLGDGRWVLRRPHQYVLDDDILAEIDAFLATLTVPDEVRAQVPATFDGRLYLARNQDVLHARESPWQHYLNHGRDEGRVW